LASAQEVRWDISQGMVAVLEDGTTRKMLSAYLMYELPGVRGWRSEAFNVKATGPRTDSTERGGRTVEFSLMRSAAEEADKPVINVKSQEIM